MQNRFPRSGKILIPILEDTIYHAVCNSKSQEDVTLKKQPMYRNRSSFPHPFHLRCQLHIGKFLTAGLLLLSIFLASCSGSDDQREFEREAFRAPSDITETNGSGETTGNEDPDDWRTAPFFQGLVEVLPAYPNPVQSTQDVRIDIFISGIESQISGLTADVWFDDGRHQHLDSIDQNLVSTGTYTLNFHVSLLGQVAHNPSGLKRIVIRDHDNNVISYGDIEVVAP